MDTSTPRPPPLRSSWPGGTWPAGTWPAGARSAVFVAVLISSSPPFWLLLRSAQLDGFGLLLPTSALVRLPHDHRDGAGGCRGRARAGGDAVAPFRRRPGCPVRRLGRRRRPAPGPRPARDAPRPRVGDTPAGAGATGCRAAPRRRLPGGGTGRGGGLDRLPHRPGAPPPRHCGHRARPRCGLGCLAPGAVPAGGARRRVDRVAVPGNGGRPRPHRRGVRGLRALRADRRRHARRPQRRHRGAARCGAGPRPGARGRGPERRSRGHRAPPRVARRTEQAPRAGRFRWPTSSFPRGGASQVGSTDVGDE